MFWTIVVPAVLYGSEIWLLNDKNLTLIESFQYYACKRFQRFYDKVPNAPALYALGWMRLERYIHVKKLSFIRSILAHNYPTISKRVFCERARVIFRNPLDHNVDPEYSIVLDLLNVATLFGMYQIVRNIVERDHLYDKHTWKRMIWEKAWSLEDAFWQVECRIHKSLDLLENVGSGNRYLSWWFIADKFPTLIIMCENMAKLVCHASLLRADDVR